MSGRWRRFRRAVLVALSTVAVTGGAAEAALTDGLLIYSSMDDAAVNRGGVNPPPALSTDGGDWVVQDLAGPGEHGTATSLGAATITSSATGRIGQAIDFSTDETSARHVSYGDVHDITGSTSQTISLWFNSREADTTAYIASKGNSGSAENGWSLWIEPTGAGRLVARAEYAGSNDATQNLGLSRSFTSSDTNAWHHLVLVVDNTSGVMSAWYDGLSSGVTGGDNGWQSGGYGGAETHTFTPGRDFSNPFDLRLGNRRDNGVQWSGLIDDLAIWDRSLTAGEITTIYQLGVSGQTFAVPTPAALYGGLMGLAMVMARRRR